MLDLPMVPSSAKEDLLEIIETKRSTNEREFVEVPASLLEEVRKWYQIQIEQTDTCAKFFPRRDRPTWEPLNELFLQMISE